MHAETSSVQCLHTPGTGGHTRHRTAHWPACGGTVNRCERTTGSSGPWGRVFRTQEQDKARPRGHKPGWRQAVVRSRNQDVRFPVQHEAAPAGPGHELPGEQSWGRQDAHWQGGDTTQTLREGSRASGREQRCLLGHTGERSQDSWSAVLPWTGARVTTLSCLPWPQGRLRNTTASRHGGKAGRAVVTTPQVH